MAKAQSPKPKKPSRRAGGPSKASTRGKARPSSAALPGSAGSGDGSEVRSEGFRELTWGGFDALAHELAQKVAKYDPELVIGIVKGGLFVGSAVAGILRREFIPVRLSKRSRDRLRLTPGVRNEIPTEARGKRVLVVDDVIQSGDTLRQALGAVAAAGASQVRSAALVVHGSRHRREKSVKSTPTRPDWFAIETDDLVVFPWDYELRAVGASEQDPGESGA